MNENHEINERELEQVSGGENLHEMQVHLRCPVCGYERWVNVTPLNPIRIVLTCTACRRNGQVVNMERIF